MTRDYFVHFNLIMTCEILSKQLKRNMLSIICFRLSFFCENFSLPNRGGAMVKMTEKGGKKQILKGDRALVTFTKMLKTKDVSRAIKKQSKFGKEKCSGRFMENLQTVRLWTYMINQS